MDSVEVRLAPDLRASISPAEWLQRGDRVFLARGPVAADALSWWYVSTLVPAFWQPFGCEAPPSCRFPALGWVAAGTEQAPKLTPVDLCPSAPVDASALWNLAPLTRLACFADRTLTIHAQLDLASRGWDMPLAVADPAWLGGEYSSVVLLPPSEGGTARVDEAAVRVLPVRFEPRFGACQPGADLSACTLLPLDGQVVELDVTIDHPVAATCTPVDLATTSEVAVEVAVLRCRAQLVVTGVRTIGGGS